jgi:hypothetical protein
MMPDVVCDRGTLNFSAAAAVHGKPAFVFRSKAPLREWAP